jgi:hypothetical protein
LAVTGLSVAGMLFFLQLTQTTPLSGRYQSVNLYRASSMCRDFVCPLTIAAASVCRCGVFPKTYAADFPVAGYYQSFGFLLTVPFVSIQCNAYFVKTR